MRARNCSACSMPRSTRNGLQKTASSRRRPERCSPGWNRDSSFPFPVSRCQQPCRGRGGGVFLRHSGGIQGSARRVGVWLCKSGWRRRGGRMFRGSVRTLGTLLATVMLTAAPALGQIQAGSIVVRAIDDQGAVMPGASVTVTSRVLPREIVGATDTSGVYQLPGLTPGNYTLRISLDGFQTVIREDIIVRQGQTAN